MKDYPEDQHLLSRKAAKAKKEAAAKQAAAKPKVLKSEDVSRFIFFIKSSILLMTVVAGYIWCVSWSQVSEDCNQILARKLQTQQGISGSFGRQN